MRLQSLQLRTGKSIHMNKNYQQFQILPDLKRLIQKQYSVKIRNQVKKNHFKLFCVKYLRLFLINLSYFNIKGFKATTFFSCKFIVAIES